MCVLINESYKTYQTGFSFCRLGQTWSYGISNRQGWQAEQNASKIFIQGSNRLPWGEVKRSNIIKFRLPCQFQRFFITNFVCALTNKRYKTYHMGFLFCRLGHAPGVGLWGTWGAQGVKKYFLNMIMWHIKSTGWRAEQVESKNFILGSNWWPLSEV